jgi:hypothetical protein
VIELYLDSFCRALARQGVRGRSARRLLDESRDHLFELSARHGEEKAVGRFGDAETIARTVAAQLATTRTRVAAYETFGALALTAIAYLAVAGLVDRGGGSADLFGAEHEGLGVLAVAGMFFFPQVAFVCGCLALLRTLRLRRRPTLPSGELSVIRARAAAALAAGVLTACSLALFGLEFRQSGIVVVLAVAVALPLGAAGVAVARSAQPRTTAGPAGTLFDDLEPVFRFGPLRGLPGHPWRLALLTTVAVAAATFVVGSVAEGDPLAGLLRSAVEAVAILAGFAALGRRLALR